MVGVYGYKDDWNVRDAKKQWGGAQQTENVANRNKGRPGWKTSRPAVYKGNKNAGRGGMRNNKSDGSAAGNRNAWTQQKNRKSSDLDASKN